MFSIVLFHGGSQRRYHNRPTESHGVTLSRSQPPFRLPLPISTTSSPPPPAGPAAAIIRWVPRQPRPPDRRGRPPLPDHSPMPSPHVAGPGKIGRQPLCTENVNYRQSYEIIFIFTKYFHLFRTISKNTEMSNKIHTISTGPSLFLSTLSGLRRLFRWNVCFGLASSCASRFCH